MCKNELVLEEDNLRMKIIEATEVFQKAVALEDKDYLRQLHQQAKQYGAHNSEQLLSLLKKYQDYIIEPEELDIEKISPVLKNVKIDKKWEELFFLIRHTWSMPYNKGFGRRLRYVVFDRYHGAVMGIIGLQSPPADLACRDNLFDYPQDKKMELINQTMDIYSLGSVPPYSGLLGGKLVAGLAASKEVCRDYKKKYAEQVTLLDGKELDTKLVALTTTSAFGRSSIYNRLKYKDRLLAEPIGYTKGYGSIHLDAVYPEIRQFLENKDVYHYGGYGKGPKQRWQNIGRALSLLEVPQKKVKHGVEREVFLYRLVDKLERGMSGGKFGKSTAIDSKEFSAYWLERWAIPRAHRKPEWEKISTMDYFKSTLEGNIVI